MMTVVCEVTEEELTEQQILMLNSKLATRYLNRAYRSVKVRTEDL